MGNISKDHFKCMKNYLEDLWCRKGEKYKNIYIPQKPAMGTH